MPSAPARCPHCDVVMDAVTARATSGYLLLLDQCPRCGGIWCDRWELYPLDAAEARRLDAVDDTRLHAPPPPDPPRPGRCPRCTGALRAFRDPLLPADAVIERCPVCDGMWCNRGALASLKRRSRRLPAGDAADRLARLLSTGPPPAPPPTVANLDAATYAAEPAPAPFEWRDWLSRAGPWLALFTLLKVLLR